MGDKLDFEGGRAVPTGRIARLARLRDRGMVLGGEREFWHVPPAELLFLHRKIGGMSLLAARLWARVALRPLVEGYAA